MSIENEIKKLTAAVTALTETMGSTLTKQNEAETDVEESNEVVVGTPAASDPTPVAVVPAPITPPAPVIPDPVVQTPTSPVVVAPPVPEAPIPTPAPSAPAALNPTPAPPTAIVSRPLVDQAMQLAAQRSQATGNPAEVMGIAQKFGIFDIASATDEQLTSLIGELTIGGQA